MSVTYAIFHAELKSSLRKNIQAFQKRIAGTFFIFFIGLIFSFACIRLIKFVIDNPQLFPEGSTQGYGTILLIFFALFTLRTTGITYRKIIKSKRMDLHLVQPITPRQIMLGMFYSIVIPNVFLSTLMLSLFFLGNIVTNTGIVLSNDFLILFFLLSILSSLSGYIFSIAGALYPFSRKLTFLMTLSPIIIVLMLVANESHLYPDIAIAVCLVCLFVLSVFFYFMDGLFVEALESYKINSSSHKNPIRVLQFNWLNSILGIRASSI